MRLRYWNIREPGADRPVSCFIFILTIRFGLHDLSRRPYMMDQEAEVALARSAAPDSVSVHATVKILTTSGYRVARTPELGNVGLQNAGPNSLVFQNIFVLETFRENCERADRRKSLGCQNVLENQGVRPRFQKNDISATQYSLCGLIGPLLVSSLWPGPGSRHGCLVRDWRDCRVPAPLWRRLLPRRPHAQRRQCVQGSVRLNEKLSA